MLIDSARLSPRDREVWAERERYDRVLARQASWPAREQRAHEVIREFAAAGPCYASTSWGKDSTVVAHLVATSGVKLPLVYVRMRKWESPECLQVRDVFLERFGDSVDYHEFFVTGGLRWWMVADPENLGAERSSHVKGQFDAVAAQFGDRHITGVRGEESRVRRIAVARWGEAGPNACRPIGRWTAVDVFAYLARHDLPVHPAYAMSLGGHLDRRWLRVSPIGGISNAHKNRASWEAHYYADIVRRGQEES